MSQPSPPDGSDRSDAHHASSAPDVPGTSRTSGAYGGLPRRRLLALGAAAVPASSVLGLPAPARAASADGRPRHEPLANPAHLRFLGDTVKPPPVHGHDTYRLREEPALGALWTYAERQPDGSYRRTGGGKRDPETGHFEQGAYNADDMARAAVAHLRHWRLTGSPRSRRFAYQLLRGVCYLQTTRGPHAGNVVLWQQADGTLNRSAWPPETPDPSDSGPSYWLARLVWALGEGFEAFRDTDAAFAAFLGERLRLALTALERDVLSRYGTWETADGRRVPGWLITGAADATSEAVLGLAAYIRAVGHRKGARARRAAARFAEGIAALASGGPGRWPYGALPPGAASLSQWHAWGAQMPTALAAAAEALGRPALLRTALADTAGLTPELLTAGGCDNGWAPAPVDRSQIAYGVDSRLRALLAVAETGRAPGLFPLAALTAAWYFGANAAGEAVYDPGTGVTFDGISPDGVINRNSGAESTIHGLLSMLALDSRDWPDWPDSPGPLGSPEPRVSRTDGAVGPRRLAVDPFGLGGTVRRDGLRVLEAEKAEPSGAVRTVRPSSPATGESEYSGGGYAALREGGGLAWTLPGDAAGPLLVSPVVNLVADRDAGSTLWRSRARTAGAARAERAERVDHGTGGEQGVSAVPGALLPVALPGTFAPGGVLRARAEGVGDRPLRVDAVLVRPAVARLLLSGPAGSLGLLHNGDGTPHEAELTVPGTGPVAVELYDVRAGSLGGHRTEGGSRVQVTVPAHGFAVVRREAGAG
ncbi:hypothetical protein HCC61_14550 [Streptomyces sp. HNM0575]|uniref:hypothetical protein n=1 Tax=Streptomyces sp. HNM0575 TaxID=2716338 RepID=UPI00145EBC19|nr:hypothetical protein [Streptomyces sp. HNM0575]NLU73885.1 hypothetical protein [Streptomyces sp. HNM0575]